MRRAMLIFAATLSWTVSIPIEVAARHAIREPLPTQSLNAHENGAKLGAHGRPDASMASRSGLVPLNGSTFTGHSNSRLTHLGGPPGRPSTMAINGSAFRRKH